MWLIALTTAIFIFQLLIAVIIGIFSAPDTYSYITIGQYVLRAITHPFHVLKFTDYAATLHPPIYGVFISLLLLTPSSIHEWIFPLAQGLLLLSSFLLIYFTIRTFTGRPIALIGSVIFYLYPFNILYTTILFSEIFSSFLVTLFGYVLYQYIIKKNDRAVISLVMLGFAMFFTHFSLIIFFFVALSLFFRSMVKNLINKQPVAIHVVTLIPLLLFTVWWFYIHYVNYGVPRLSIVSGRHLFNSVVVKSKLIPNHQTPQTTKFLQYIPDRRDLYKPWWINQSFFKTLPESEVDNLYGIFSITAILQHKAEFIRDSMLSVIQTFTTQPYLPKKPEAPVNYLDPSCANTCRFDFLNSMCHPIMRTCALYYPWRTFVTLNFLYYPYGSMLALITATAGAVVAIIKKNQFISLLSFVFYSTIILFASTELIEGRYLIPLYSELVILVVYAGINAKQLFKYR